MDHFKFYSVSDKTVGVYDCGTDFQNLVMLWISEGDDVSEEVDSFGAEGVPLTPNEARALAKKLIAFADHCDGAEVKGDKHG